MAKASTTTRTPRGTKILAKAFFTAADEIPEPQRAEVIKAALVAIRDELKAAREKAALAKAKAREKATKPAASSAKVDAAPKVPAKAQKKSAQVQAKPHRKPASKKTERAVTDEQAKAMGQSDA